MMIDIHSHLMFNIDDGPSKIEDSIQIISEAKQAGVKTIITTVHFHEGLFSNVDKSETAFKLLCKSVENFGVNLVLGYEIYINSINSENINRVRKLTLGDSNFILIEFPFNDFSDINRESINFLRQNSLIPILAHPERSRFFIKNPNELYALINNGCMIQVDAASIMGVYGWQVKSFAKELIKSRKVHFVASNAHFPGDYAMRYINSFNKVKYWSCDEYAEYLFITNAQSLLDNKNSLVDLVI